ncbi:MAG TPA: hypothetical protein VJ982_05000, partial [Gemmatimonadota bacterium]|nr:hypothetical protein [Gemmatimonadota bacterium]
GWVALAAAAALGAGALSRGLPRGWGLRAAFVLLAAYLALLGWFRLESWSLARGGGEAAAELEESKRQRVAEVFARRLEDDRGLLQATVGALERLEVTASGSDADADLFRALDRASPPALAAGIGFEVYDRDGRLRAWWGDPRGDRLPPDSVAVPIRRPLVRAPSGYRLAYVAAPWIAVGDTFVFAVKDLWAAESPLRREVVEPELLVARLEAIHDLAFHVAPPGFEDRRSFEPASHVAAPDGSVVAEVHSERFMIDRYIEGRRADVVRLLALLLAWPFVWALAGVWQSVRQAAIARRGSGSIAGWALAIAGQAAVVAGVWAFLFESRVLALFSPETWFSPLAFAVARLGPVGRSAGDFALTAACVALFCVTTLGVLPGRPRRLSWPSLALLAVAELALAMAILRTLVGGLEAAMAGMSPPVFFSPTILFSPPFLMVLLAFALFLSAGVIALAAILRLAGAPTGPGSVAAAAGAGALAIAGQAAVVA